MIKTLTVAAATCMALSASFSAGAHACDEDCAYEAQEAAYERAYERQAAREEAAEEGYNSGGRALRLAICKPPRAEAAQAKAAQAKRSSEPPAAERQTAEPKPDPTPRTQSPSPRIKVANENSSISTGSDYGEREVAEDDSYVRPVKSIGCKAYLARRRHDPVRALRLTPFTLPTSSNCIPASRRDFFCPAHGRRRKSRACSARDSAGAGLRACSLQ